jgi:hypothetical protein
MALIQAKHPEYHPLLAMIDIAKDEAMSGEEGDRALAFACHKEVAKYVLAVDRHVEVKQQTTQTRRVVVELFGEERPVEALPPEAVTDVEVKHTQLVHRGPAEESEVAEPPRSLSSRPIAESLDFAGIEAAGRPGRAELSVYEEHTETMSARMT